MTPTPESLWRASTTLPTSPSLERDLDIDVAIIGGGVTGLTAAVLLSRTRRVAVFERGRLGSGETLNTTSHLTEAIDARYHHVIRSFGLEAAQLVARSKRDAIDHIEQLAARTAGGAFERTPGYLYTERIEDLSVLADELDAAGRAGCAVEWIDDVPLPFVTRGAVRWERQAEVHASAYLHGLYREATSCGAAIFENTPVEEVHEGEPCELRTATHRITARHVLVAANVPVNNRVLLHTKIAAYRSYAIAVEVEPGYLRGLFWDTADPYHYTRAQDDHGRTYLLIGGGDHRTGVETHTDDKYEGLARYARAHYPGGPVKYRWSGQIIEPVDGLPFIGPNSGSSHVYVATGYSGNGITYGTLAAMMFDDHVNGRKNAYAALYDATRVKPLASAVDYARENVIFPAHLAKDRLTSSNADLRSLDEVQPGAGGIFAGPEGKVAVYRDEGGHLHGLSPVCPHLGCDVAWNRAERSWDCPCHGSRFTPDGQVVNGPAVSPLSPKPIAVGK